MHGLIIGEGLDKTGVMNIFARYIIKFAGKSEIRIMFLIAGTVAFISSFMQNIGAAVLFLPATIRIKAGSGMTILYIGVVMTIMYFFYGISG